MAASVSYSAFYQIVLVIVNIITHQPLLVD